MTEQRLIDANALTPDMGFGKRDMYSQRAIDNAPTIDPERRSYWTGWTTSAYMGVDEDKEPKWADRKFYRCHDCRKGSAVKHAFCPSCGARMGGEGE